MTDNWFKFDVDISLSFWERLSYLIKNNLTIELEVETLDVPFSFGAKPFLKRFYYFVYNPTFSIRMDYMIRTITVRNKVITEG